MKLSTKYIWVFTILTVISFSCKKFVEVGEPRTQLGGTNLFSSDGTATGALIAIYSQMEAEGLFYNLLLNTGLSGDEFRCLTTFAPYVDMANNNLTADNSFIATQWNNYYKLIYQANAVIEGVTKSNALNESTKKLLEGEARFVRALLHFYLVNLFGEVPIVKTTSYEDNSSVRRSPINQVYNAIIEDLVQAVQLLDTEYKNGTNTTTTERVRPNKFSALALLSRAYLYGGNWQESEQKASMVIGATNLYNLETDLNNVFLKGSKEAIWQLRPVLPSTNTFAGSALVVTGAPSLVSINTGLVALFQPNDNRRNAWITTATVNGSTFYKPFKYKVGQNVPTITEYTMVLRLAEQFLIRAEARAMQDNLLGAEQDFNKIRTRAGLPALTGLSKANLLDSIQAERNLELFCESADRWLNLKRKGTITGILSPVKGNNWAPYDALYPIPQVELLRNPLLTQNPGY
ncbi:MAG TPA: RagB/SusD family nutrient uptake outer membrane protein [Flavisolibacter sp.]|nr:RagB/SusD family nutrient uptake outer membrane protein [Flavisolibacter sp.]